MVKTVCVLGHGRHGKDETLKALERLTGLKNAGPTSLYLAEHMGQKLGLSTEEAYARRHESPEMRNEWYEEANRLRDGDPSFLARKALAVGPLTGGLRDDKEVAGCRAEGLFDLIIWVRNPRKPEDDKTVKFGPDVADFILLNDGTVQDLEDKVARIVQFAGLRRHFHFRDVFGGTVYDSREVGEGNGLLERFPELAGRDFYVRTELGCCLYDDRALEAAVTA